MRYVLEVQGFVDWEVERPFDTVDLAMVYGRERFSHNAWRIVDRFSASEVVYLHDPTTAFAQSATHDIERFAATDRWIAQRSAPQRVPQRQRMGRIANRQATVGPRITHTYANTRLHTEFYSRVTIADLLAAIPEKKKEVVNWKVEGF